MIEIFTFGVHRVKLIYVLSYYDQNMVNRVKAHSYQYLKLFLANFNPYFILMAIKNA